MEEQLITLDTAKLAKAKGFDSGFSIMCIEADAFKKDHCIVIEGIGEVPNEDYKHDLMICTQSLLQKWLRENHNIRLEIQSLIDCTYAYSIYQELQDNKYCKQIAFEFTEQYSYENALEIGLKHALKLI